MPVIRTEASSDDLLDAVMQLSSDELAAFTERVVTLKAERLAAHLSQDETALLLRIGRGLPPDTRRRYDELMAKRRAESLSAGEHAELMRLTDEAEHLDADRADALIVLAGSRRTSPIALMRSLGMQPTHDGR